MMKIFVNTTVPKVAVVSLIDEKGNIVAQEKSNEPLLAIEKILKQNKLSLEEIEVFESHPGRGSFTGLRVGSASIQTLNFALGKKVRNQKLKY